LGKPPTNPKCLTLIARTQIGCQSGVPANWQYEYVLPNRGPLYEAITVYWKHGILGEACASEVNIIDRIKQLSKRLDTLSIETLFPVAAL
jgi:hypothetical protein